MMIAIHFFHTDGTMRVERNWTDLERAKANANFFVKTLGGHAVVLVKQGRKWHTAYNTEVGY